MVTKPEIDLSELARDRSPSGDAPPRRHRRRWLSRYLVPCAILLGFAGLLVAAASSSLLPRRAVQVMPVIVKRSAIQREGTPMFQAAGWIEPRPTAIRVAALAPGVIEQLLVVEGQLVEKDEPIARLIRIDAELAVEQAKATLGLREGELARAVAERDAAKVRLKNPVHLQVELADAKSLLAKSNTESAKLPFLIEAAEAKIEFTRRSLESKQAAGDAIAGRVLDQARNEHAAASASIRELQQRGPNLKSETEAFQAKVDALQKQLELLIEEKRQLQEAEAKVQSGSALRDEGELGLRQAELLLERTVVRAPISGRILALLAAPGTRVMGLNAVAGQNSSTVVEMYDPARLQVRADVRLEDVPMVSRGSTVNVVTASSEAVIEGRVLRATSTANIQKNTLEVKVELLDPPEWVGPEMLVTATFLAPPDKRTRGEPTETERVFVPSQLIQTHDGDSVVWVVDANQRAQRRVILLGGVIPGDLAEVRDGLTVTDKLIASDTTELSSGSRVTVTGEETSLGTGKR
jgi:HlyD family secretion protein